MARAILALGFLGCASPLPPHTDGFIPVSGGDRLYYRVYGSGSDTVVALHGGPALSAAYLEPALAPLVPHHTIIVYDQRGRGRSPEATRPESLSYQQDIDDLSQVRSHFHLDSMSLVGHHWGAAVAFGLSVRHPEQVRRLTLISPIGPEATFIYQLAGLPRDTIARSLWDRARQIKADSTDPEGFCREFWGFGFSPAEVTSNTLVHRLAPLMCDESPERLRRRTEIGRTLMASLGRWSWRDSLALVKAPTLVIVGADQPLQVTGATAWAQHIPNGRVMVLGQTPLFPWVGDEELWFKDLDGYLGGQWPGTSVRPTVPATKT